MAIRLSKCILILSIALFLSLVVLNNLTDYDSNFQFVRHVLQMDSTFPNNRGMWRSITSPTLHHLFYDSIILWESLTTLTAWWGAVCLLRALKNANAFNSAKAPAIAALTMGIVLWFLGFIAIGGEWFLMWQSKIWNGQDAAFRLVVILGTVLIYLATPDPESTHA